MGEDTECRRCGKKFKAWETNFVFKGEERVCHQCWVYEHGEVAKTLPEVEINLMVRNDDGMPKPSLRIMHRVDGKRRTEIYPLTPEQLVWLMCSTMTVTVKPEMTLAGLEEVDRRLFEVTYD